MSKPPKTPQDNTNVVALRVVESKQKKKKGKKKKVAKDNHLVECLENALKEAKSGNYTEVAIVLASHGEGYRASFALDDSHLADEGNGEGGRASLLHLIGSIGMLESYVKSSFGSE